MKTIAVPVSYAEIAGAVARGWCWPQNSHKEMDSNLAMAITVEVNKLLAAAPPQPEPANDLILAVARALDEWPASSDTDNPDFEDAMAELEKAFADYGAPQDHLAAPDSRERAMNAAPEQSEREQRSSPSQEGCGAGTAPAAAPNYHICYSSMEDRLHCVTCGRELLDLAVSAAPRFEDELLKPQTVLKITAPDMQSLPSSDKEWKGPYVQPNSSGSMGDKPDNAAPEQEPTFRVDTETIPLPPASSAAPITSSEAVSACSRCGKVGANLDDGGHTCITFCGTPLFSGTITSGLTVSSGFATNNAAGQVDPVKAISTGQPASQSDRPVPAAPVSSAEAYAMDCEGYAVPAAPTPGTEFYWLIEREQGGSHVPTVWYSGRADERNTDYNEWTDNVYLALRFASQSDAEKVAERLFCPRSVRVRKHGFDIRSVMFCDPSFDTPTTMNLWESALPLSKIWSCKIGEIDSVPHGADAPMRTAIAAAYKQLTGKDCMFLFSGWGAELTEPERAVVENRLPSKEFERAYMLERQVKTFCMDYRLKCDADTKRLERQLAEKDREFSEYRELTVMQMAAISTCATSNSRNSAAPLHRNHPYWTGPYGDVVTAVSREIRERERAEKAETRAEWFKVRHEKALSHAFNLGNRVEELEAELAELRRAK